MYPFFLTPTARKPGSSHKQQNNTKTMDAALMFFFSPKSKARSVLNFLKHFFFIPALAFSFHMATYFSLISTLSQNNWLLQVPGNETAVRGKQSMIIPVLMKSGRSLNCFREETGLVTLNQNFTWFAVQPFLVEKKLFINSTTHVLQTICSIH